MPLNYQILEKFGTTNQRLRELFTAQPVDPSQRSSLSKEECDCRDADVKMREKIEDLVQSRIDESISLNLKHSHLFSAVDLAWDSSTITGQTIPLVMYAQGRISMEECVTRLDQLKCADKYVKSGEGGKRRIDIPKVSEVNVNIMRSIITRRVAAQSARFSNFWPFFKYEARDWSNEAKMRADLWSTIVDIMADQYGYRAARVQWIRDMLLYPYAVVFPACQWNREVEWVLDDTEKAEEFVVDEQSAEKVRVRSKVKREGVPLILPHASRVFYDVAYPITSINSDSGCEWFGFWDINRFSTIDDNPDFFNRDKVGWNQDHVSWWTAYASYWQQYYTQVSLPNGGNPQPGVAVGNDRKENLGWYSQNERDASVFEAHYYWKVVPNQWRMGRYPFPVWIHLTVVNSSTIVHAEIMPDTPGFVFSHNTSSQRLMNLSMGHELLSWNDQLTSLFTELLEAVKRDLFGVAVLNLDAFPTDNEEAMKALDAFRSAMKGESFWSSIATIEVSLIKMRDLGVDLDKVFKVVRQEAGSSISDIIRAIGQTISLAERVMCLSPQEQGQPTPREISATEVNVMASTTETMYMFITDSVDEGCAALKRYLYNAFMALGSNEVRLPVAGRYPRGTAEKLGLVVESTQGADFTEGEGKFTAVAKKGNLAAELLFTSRDGSDRASNIQAAQVLTQLLNVLAQPAVMQNMTRGQFATVVNGIIRQSGGAVDVVIEPPPGSEDQPLLAAVPQAPSGVVDGGKPQQPVSPPVDDLQSVL